MSPSLSDHTETWRLVIIFAIIFSERKVIWDCHVTRRDPVPILARGGSRASGVQGDRQTSSISVKETSSQSEKLQDSTTETRMRISTSKRFRMLPPASSFINKKFRAWKWKRLICWGTNQHELQLEIVNQRGICHCQVIAPPLDEADRNLRKICLKKYALKNTSAVKLSLRF